MSLISVFAPLWNLVSHHYSFPVSDQINCLLPLPSLTSIALCSLPQAMHMFSLSVPVHPVTQPYYHLLTRNWLPKTSSFPSSSSFTPYFFVAAFPIGSCPFYFAIKHQPQPLLSVHCFLSHQPCHPSSTVSPVPSDKYRMYRRRVSLSFTQVMSLRAIRNYLTTTVWSGLLKNEAKLFVYGCMWSQFL